MAYRFKVFGCVVVICVLAVYFLPVLMRHDVYSNDAAQNISWMYRFSNPSLFANCEMRDYCTTVFAPFGFRAIYSGLARLADAKVVSELLSFPLAILTLIGAYSLGRLVTNGNVRGGVAGAATVLFGAPVGLEFNYLGPIAGGLQRSFALPILAFGVVGVAGRRPPLTAAMLLASALFYPPAFLVLGVFQFMVLVLDIVHRRSSLKQLLWLALSGIASMGVLLRMQQQSAAYGPSLTLAEMLRMPDFYPGGVFYDAILFTNKMEYVIHAFPMSARAVPVWIVGVAVCAWCLRRAIRVEAWLMLLSGFLLYGLAYALLFRLYDPGRYPLYALLMFHLILVPPVYIALESKIRERMASPGPALWLSNMAQRATVLAAVAALVLAAATCLVAYRYHVKGGGMTSDIPDPVYQYLSTLPPDTCIAGHPTDVNDVPLRSRRCAPLLIEALGTRQRDFRQKVFAQLGDILSLMYAGNTTEIRALRGRLNCKIFLVNADRYTNDRLATLKPTDAIIAELRRKALVATPLLLHPPSSAVLFSDGPVSVVDLDLLGDGPEPVPEPHVEKH